ncbi:MAG: hypothetical protein P1U65_00735 [Minwuia sp.]|nr:hypothetical protein [Minwuia sp.]
METSSTQTDAEECGAQVATVSESILMQFFDELAKDESLSEIAPNLRKTVLDDGVFAEPAIRAAIFPDAP